MWCLVGPWWFLWHLWFVLIAKVLIVLEGALSVIVKYSRTFVWSSRRHYSQEMFITSTITKSDYSHLHKNVSYLLRDLGAEYPMYLYQHKTRFKFIFLVKHNPNRQCRLADEKIFWSRCLRTFRSNPNFVRDVMTLNPKNFSVRRTAVCLLFSGLEMLRKQRFRIKLTRLSNMHFPHMWPMWHDSSQLGSEFIFSRE